jgi:hypothetical protein
MDFGPRLDQPLLRLRQATLQTFDRVDREDGRMFLIEGVKVRSVMLHAGFDEHPDDDAKESREFWHPSTLHRAVDSSSG